jgi:Cu-processing system permease protein
MGKVIKYKVLTLLEDKVLISIFIIFFLILNYHVFINSGLISEGSSDFNAMLKYALLLNNFIVVISLFGLIVAIYIGAGLIGKDISSGQIYILLSSFSNRINYFLGNWLGLTFVLLCFILLVFINFFSASVALGIKINYPDLGDFLKSTLFNLLVIMTITATFSIFMKGYNSILGGIVSLIIYNMYAFEKIPFLNYSVLIDMKIRKLMATLVPLSDMNSYSLQKSGYQRIAPLIEPYLIENITIYQIVFLLLLLLGCIILFNRKEL